MRSTRYSAPTVDRLRKLAERRDRDVVTVLVPPLPIAEARLTLRNLIRDVEARSANGSDPRVERLASVLDDHDVWIGPTASLALYLSEANLMRLPGPQSGEPLAVVGPRFHVTHLLGASPPLRYAVLALSRGSSHLYRGRGAEVTEQQTSGLPAVMSEVLRYDDRDPQFQSHGSARRGGGVLKGASHGQGGRNGQRADVERYLRFVAAEVEEVLGGEPLVLAATDELAAAFRKLSTYPEIAAEHLVGNAEHRSVSELGDAAVGIVQKAAEERRGTSMRELMEEPTARVVYDLGEVLTAACDGRVERLAVIVGERVWGEYDDAERRIVRVVEDEGPVDLVNEAAAETWLHGGDIIAAASGEIPSPWPVAGLLRF